LIEGVNTKAKNVIIFDDKINNKSIDFFTFNNIKGRSGRMGQHYIGHVYLFNPAPTDPLPFVDIPAFSQPDDVLASLLLQLDQEDLSSKSKARLRGYLSEEFLDYETLKANSGIDPEGQIEVAKAIRSDLTKYSPLLQWTGMPQRFQVYGICDLIWKPFRCSRLGSGRAKSAKQLAYRLIGLHAAPSTKELITKSYEHHKDADLSVQEVLDFLRLWSTFHFPQLLRGLDRIQKDVFRRVKRPSGDYAFYAGKIENRFLPGALVALEEYGIPLEVARKLQSRLLPADSLDPVLDRLRSLNVDQVPLSSFERRLVRDAQKSL
jgi:hypothetical protein